jgi:hypothetical protein
METSNYFLMIALARVLNMTPSRACKLSNRLMVAMDEIRREREQEEVRDAA